MQFLWINVCLTVLYTSTHGALQTLYNITHVSNHSGLYFENKGSVRIVNTRWTLLTYVNLTFYNEREKIFDTYLDSTKQFCIENELIPSKSNIICQHFKTVFTDFTKEILNKRANILKTLGHTSKRGGEC